MKRSEGLILDVRNNFPGNHMDNQCCGHIRAQYLGSEHRLWKSLVTYATLETVVSIKYDTPSLYSTLQCFSRLENIMSSRLAYLSTERRQLSYIHATTLGDIWWQSRCDLEKLHDCVLETIGGQGTEVHVEDHHGIFFWDFLIRSSKKRRSFAFAALLRRYPRLCQHSSVSIFYCKRRVRTAIPEPLKKEHTASRDSWL